MKSYFLLWFLALCCCKEIAGNEPYLAIEHIENQRHVLSIPICSGLDDVQQTINTGNVYHSMGYMELMDIWFCRRWGGGMRFQNVQLPRESIIISAYIMATAYSTCWLHTYDSVACENVDSAEMFLCGAGTYDLSNRWENRTTSVLWNEDMRKSSIHPDSTCDLSVCLQDIMFREDWKPGNSLVFLFKNLKDEADSAMYEIRTFEDTGWAPVLIVEFLPGFVAYDYEENE